MNAFCFLLFRLDFEFFQNLIIFTYSKPAFGSAFGRNEIITRGEKQCGQRQFEEIDLPDSEVSPGEFPWTCSLWSINGAAEEYLGSCAIVPNERGV